MVQIYEDSKKVIAKSFDQGKNKFFFRVFKSVHQENLSKILFPEKKVDLNGKTLYAVYADAPDENDRGKGIQTPNCKWTHYLEIIAKKLNLTVNYFKIPDNESDISDIRNWIAKLIYKKRLDFYLRYGFKKVKYLKI